MDKYININKLSKIKKHLFKTEIGAFPKSEWFIKLEDVFSIPEEKVKKITYGHWIPHETMIRTPYARNYDCSVCGNSPIECGDYCNKCGSYMKGEK